MRGELNKIMMSRNLKSARVRAGLTVGEVAERMMVTRQCVYIWERDPSKLKVTQLDKLAELYGCDLAYFFGL